MKKKILMFAAASVFLASCGGGGSRPTFGDNEYPVVTVGTSSTQMQTTYPATIKGVQDVQICPKVQGFITQPWPYYNINIYNIRQNKRWKNSFFQLF